MTHQKLTDAMASTDQQTKLWKARFSAAKAAYTGGDFRQCETLLFRAMEMAKTLQESTFATNTCEVGLGAVYLATGKLDKAKEHLDRPVKALSGNNDPALKELYAVALRFHSAIFFEQGDQASAEKELQEAIQKLGDLGTEGAVQLAYVTGDLATLYVMSGNLKDAKELIFSAMALLEESLGPESAEYVRANIIYNICDSEGDEQRLAQIEDGIYDMQYQHGKAHPNILRALRWYLKKREERGESELVAEAKERFALHDKKLKY